MTNDNKAAEDREYDPAVEPESSSAWLNLIVDAEKVFKDYQDKSDNIDKLYANLNRLAAAGRDREFQMFWANIQVIGPSIYSRPPVPVVVPRFRERRPIPRTTSELLERATSVMFEQEDIDCTMRLIRDDLTILARGVAWLRYESKEGKYTTEKVCIEHVDRKDFLHDPARKWKEVDWVGRRAWMTSDEMKDRFSKHSGDAYKTAAFTVQRDKRDTGAANPREKAGVWEIWSKSQDKVVWVTEGVEELLDSNKPHLKLDNFFPCPRPAYSTVQRPSLVPVPDMAMYKDQLEEINELTGRIGALADAVKVRGFYPAGASEIGDAVEAAVKSLDNRQILVPISNWAAFGQGGDPIVWLPIEMIATVIVQLVELRRQLIDDVYQITGLSDIMRGSTEASETLGAQQLKSQYGSIRIRDRQDELVRIARDISRIAAEIMAEQFTQKTLLEMSQLDLPTDSDIRKQIDEIKDEARKLKATVEKQVEKAQADPALMAKAQENPEEAEQMVTQMTEQAEAQLKEMQAQAEKIAQTVTIDQVMKLLREQRLRPFILDIETDSTIAPDENAQKQRATEFITAIGGFLNQAITAVQAVPQVAPLMADTLKYVASQFRAGRELDATIDEFADQMKQMGQTAKPDPEGEAAAAQTKIEEARLQGDMQAKAADAKLRQDQATAEEKRRQEQAVFDAKLKVDQAKAKYALDKAESDERMKGILVENDAKSAKLAAEAQKHAQEMEKGGLEIILLKTKIEQSKVQTDNSIKSTEAGVSATADKTKIAAEAVKAKSKEPA